MKKTRLIVALLLVVCFVLSFALAACQPVEPDPDPTPVDELTYAEGTKLRMATGYNGPTTGITYKSGDAIIGKTITTTNTVVTTGALKPTWVEMQKRLNVEFEDVYTGASSAQNEWDYWNNNNKLAEVDMVAGSTVRLQAGGAAGKLVNLADYLDKMPNFKAYLDANPIVKLSITGSTTGASKGAIYFSPYFDGVNDIERMPLMRIDWVEELLNGSTAFAASQSKTFKDTSYSAFIDSSKSIAIESLNKDGTGLQTITKDYAKALAAIQAKYPGITFTSGNVVTAMNEYVKASATGRTGVELVNFFRTYIDGCYGSTYTPATRANLFVGYDAAWDVDELVALLRCVTNNSHALNGTDTIVGLFQRDKTVQRTVDMTRFAGILFGVRGLESRSEFNYFDADGNLQDCRLDAASYDAMNKMHEMFEEGLVWQEMATSNTKIQQFIEDNIGFMEYDYSQTQTLYNAKNDTNAKFSAVMIPVSLWQDGTPGGQYMRFTESWRSVKTDGWAISLEGVKGNTDKLNAALKLIDYAYTEKGMVLLSYGPDEFIKTNADGSWVTFDFNGVQCPVIADKTAEDLQTLAGGNYTNFARYFLGSTLSFVKMQSFEYQCTTAQGKEGAAKLSAAVGLGTVKHPFLEVCENMWYTSVPTTLPLTATETGRFASYSAFNSSNSGEFGAASSSTYNYYVDMIMKGYNGAITGGSANYPANGAAIVAQMTANGGSVYMTQRSAAWTRLLTFYATL